MNYLASLGHTRIAALGTYHEVILPDERTGVFPRIMREAGLSLPQAYQRVIHPTPHDAYLLTKELMGLADPPTALFSTTGNLATGAFRALKELQLKIPDDVSLLTFDDYLWTSLVDPPIDVIGQPVDEMGEAAAKLVLREIDAPSGPAEHLRFPGQLIRRGSCAPPPNYKSVS